MALLGTGVALVLLGEATARRALFTVLGQRVDALTLHQAAFAMWAAVTGLHVLGRLLPAWQLTMARRRDVPGRRRRAVALLVVLVLSAACADWVLAQPGGWRSAHHHRPFDGGQPGTSEEGRPPVPG
jgi:hypothetical protein